MVFFYVHFVFIFLLVVKWPSENDFIIESKVTFKITATVELNILMLDNIQALWL